MAAMMGDATTTTQVRDEDGIRIQEQFALFLHEREIYVRDLKDLDQPERNTLSVNFNHLQEDNPPMSEQIISNYYRFHPFLCASVRQLATELNVKIGHKEVYVAFTDFDIRHKVRELTAERIGTMMRISGQVVRTHPVHPELCKGFFMCDECNTPCPNIQQQFKYTQPTKCANPSCQNRIRFQLDVHKSLFTDFQKARIQETQAEMPRGSIPRSVEIILRGECVEIAQPGDRCDFTGTLIVIPDVAQMSIPGAKVQSSAHHRGQKTGDQEGLQGLKTLGVRDLNYKLAFLACCVVPTNPMFGGRDYSHEKMAVEELHEKMSQEEKDQVKKMAQDKNLVHNMINSLFPAIHGHGEVKKGVMLMLFGGVPKTTGEGTTLRGDINVCLVGDPSTAKSQVLKQIESFSPRAVYTSGKASSAAGLTAAVVKDEESYEFVIEAGALMLADNGVCCIDEFDKMDPKDQVAIHEAMEQQTISITKAGVKATLNARTSILAAANPIGGRYDRSKSLRQNIQLSAPIMSRFDLFFVLVDECNEVMDYAIAQRILETHQKKEDIPDRRKYTQDDIQRYIMFARCFKPQLSDEAAVRLVTEYKDLRMRDSSGSTYVSSWRVTVRQLESMIRLSEALARLHLDDLVREDHVVQAAALLNKSIVRVEQADIQFDDDIEYIEEGEKENQPMEEEQGNVEKGGEIDASAHRMSFDEFRRITNLLVGRLRKEQDTAEGMDIDGQLSEEEKKKKSGVKEDEKGMLRQSKLVDWYLQHSLDEVESEEELNKLKVIVDKVIYRLIHHDNILIALSTMEENDENNEKSAEKEKSKDEEEKIVDDLLVVHPNYVPEGF